MREMLLADVLSGWVPGSQDQPWTWDDEERDLHSHPCPIVHARSIGLDIDPCGDPLPGCYQRALEAWLGRLGHVPSPISLGSDGRVWDGHHRIIAARRLGFATIPVED